jgi:hypothetical protein
MGFRWEATSSTETGIDGHVELFEPSSGEALSSWLLLQSKASSAFPGETERRFHFLCDEADVNYWCRQPLPVILVCSHPDTDEAWWRHVQDAFRNPAARKARRVEFDKEADRLDSGAVAALIELGVSAAPRAWTAPAQRQEKLVTNLLPVTRLAPVFYGAPTSVRTPAQAVARLKDSECRGNDWVLHNKMVFSIRGMDDLESPLHVLADDASESFETTEWSDSKDPDIQRRFVRLLNGTMRDIFAQDLAWYSKGSYFFFRALDLSEDRRIVTGKGAGRIVFTSKVISGADGPFVLWYRHHALRCHFQRIDGSWYLTLDPTYHYSFDGYHRCRKSGEWVKKMKSIERNSAVRGTVAFWAKYLCQPEDRLFDNPDPRLGFGSLPTVTVDRGIDEATWREVGDGAEAADSEESSELVRMFDDEDLL